MRKQAVYALFMLCSFNLFAAHHFFVSSYTHPDILAHEPQSPDSKLGEGITLVEMSDEGTLTNLSHTPCINPAVLQVNPNKRSLYALSERIDQKGSVLVFDINLDYSLNLRQEYHAQGKSTCYIGINAAQKIAIISNYWDSIIELTALNNDGSLGEASQVFQQHERTSFRQVTSRYDHWQNRQVGPHAHSVYFWRNWVFIPDLGENAIFQYRLENRQLVFEAATKLKPGSGPRHMAFHASLPVVYISNELASTVTMAKLDNQINLIEDYSTLLEPSASKNYVSELSLSPDQKFLYVSNRGHDSIAIFAVDQSTGALTLVETCASGGKFPRHFAISPDGKFIIVANQNSNSLVVFSRDALTGKLQATGQSLEIALPNFIKFHHAY